ncbi:MAG: hypothetical protein F6K22_36080, partial [Okeania sp. SIO2F4]|uniref:GUN4 domain-containing protein n=1 Tax=Okeania sp. SIO2F4 TaxID=2607790 RepID=UPI00142A0600
ICGPLNRFLRVRFNKEFLSAGDNFWFFYSGHGMRFKDRDYLMPADADPHPDGVEYTAISLYFVTERLRRCGADNVILFLDACRSQESSKGLGIGKEKQKGVITFFSCSPNERSYEIEDERIQQGSFTYALLESLRIKGEGNCATVERLDNRLSGRVSDINRQFRKPRQTPYSMVEPITKSHLILLQKQANSSDIATLKNDAYRAEVEKNLELARQLWIRVNIAASGSDMDATDAMKRLSKSTNNLKSGDEQPSDDQGEKSPHPNIPEKNKFLPNNFKLKYAVLVGIMGIVLLVINPVIDLLIDPFGLKTNNIQNTTPPQSELQNTDNIKSNQDTTNITPKSEGQNTDNTKSNQDTTNIIGDYETLENLLRQKRLKEADQETFSIMLKVTNQENAAYLNQKSIENFPCSDLRRIDQLWVKYSNGKFGFSVQNKIYQRLGGKRNLDDEIWEKFGKEVGWHQGEKWLYYNNLQFDLSTFYKGHLPVAVFGTSGRGEHLDGPLGGRIFRENSQISATSSLLFSRAESCGL